MPAYSSSGQFARIWWNYNQQSNRVVDSHSVSSVSDIQSGFFRVNFGYTFGTRPCVAASCSYDSSVTSNSHSEYIKVYPNTSDCNVGTPNSDMTYHDCAANCGAAFGDN